MDNNSVFIKNILDSSNLDTISNISSLSIITLNNNSINDLQKGGRKSETSFTESYLTTTNDITYGKKNKKTKKSIMSTRNKKNKKKKKETDDTSSSESSNSSSFNDSEDSTSISSDEYPLFNY